MKLKKIMSGALVVVLMSAIVGCNSDEKKTSSNVDFGKGYPLETEETLVVWDYQFAGVNTKTLSATNFSETPLAKEIEKKTGIKIKYMHPPANQATEQFNLMVASREMPDIIIYNWANYPGGAQQAIDSNVIYSLNDLIDEYAPNLKKYIDSNADVAKTLKTDDGNYYVFPQIRGSELTKTYFGPIVREDWLEELGLKYPETIDEWHTMLTAFKEKKGVKAPLSFTTYDQKLNLNDAFIGAFNTSQNFFVNDDGKVEYGPVTDGFRSFVETFANWYKEGLIEQEFALMDSKALDGKMISGDSGACVGLLSGGLLKWMDAGKKSDEGYSLAGIKYPVENKGDSPFIGQKDYDYFPSYSAAITTQCKNPALAAKWLDYAYSEEGRLLYNFGVEGESFEMKDGTPTYTENIMNNPNGDTPWQMLTMYSKANGPYMQDERAVIFKYPQQKEAVERWADTNALKHKYPPFTSLNSEESDEYTKIMTDVDSYMAEMVVKFIMGEKPLSEYDNFVKGLKARKVDRAVEIKQAAYDRYNNR